MQTQTAAFQIEGMDCPSCAAKIQTALGKLKGVEQAEVEFTSAQLRLEYAPTQVTVGDIARKVEGLGYRLIGDVHTSNQETTSHDTLRRSLTALSALLFGVGFILEWQAGPATSAAWWSIWAVRLFYVGALVCSGYYIVRSAIASLRHLSLDMSVLMSVAIAGALIIGEWSEGVMVAVLFAFAQFLETRSMARARKAISDLMNIVPLEATILRNGQTMRVPVEAVSVGDTVLARPGERIPLDGVVVRGASRVNQAPITGESIPVEKSVNADVYAGTMNEHGALEIRVTKAAADTMVAQIKRQVEIAQSQKAKAQQFVDRFARVYTPCVIGLALLLPLAAWLIFSQPLATWVHRSLVLLVIACPCALAISTPVAVVSALANAARNGVLIKGGVYLELLGKLKAIAFDKTGTLTHGEPQVTDIVPLNGASTQDVLWGAITVEHNSEHAIARAIRKHAEAVGAPIEGLGEFEALPGKGAKTTFTHGGRRCGFVVGSPRLFAEYHALPTKTAQQAIDHLDAQGKTVVLVGMLDGENAKLLGFIAVADAVRAESAKALEAIRQGGIPHLTMLTGDTQRTATAVAGAVSIPDYQSELLPDEKVQAVAQLRQQYGTVAVVGDGINDAPSLASADVGIAMGMVGTDVTLEAADVVLIKDDLSALPYAIRLGRRALRIIQVNIAFALATKLVFTILAINGMATLWMAVFADMGASLLVIFNGLRLLQNGRD